MHRAFGLVHLVPPGEVPASMIKLMSTGYIGYLTGVLSVSLSAGLSATGFCFVSSHQIYAGLIHLIFPIYHAWHTCSVFPSPGVGPQENDVQSKIAWWVESPLQAAVPITVNRKSGGLLQQPCYLVNVWAVITIGYIIPLIMANRFEENLRRSFLRRDGYRMLSPSKGWTTAHACGLTVLCGGLLWVLLSTIFIWIF